LREPGGGGRGGEGERRAAEAAVRGQEKKGYGEEKERAPHRTVLTHTSSPHPRASPRGAPRRRTPNPVGPAAPAARARRVAPAPAPRRVADDAPLRARGRRASRACRRPALAPAIARESGPGRIPRPRNAPSRPTAPRRSRARPRARGGRTCRCRRTPGATPDGY